MAWPGVVVSARARQRGPLYPFNSLLVIHRGGQLTQLRV